MNRKKLTTIILALAAVLSLMLAGCGAKTEDGTAASGSGSGETAKSEDRETVVTAETREEAKKLADAFYESVVNANPVFMTFYSDGQTLSEFAMDGDKIYSGTPDMDYAYYGFIENGTKYFIGDGETAYENELMYDMIAESVKTTIDMFVLGYYNEDNDGAFQYSATKTDKTVNGAASSKLVSTITGEADGKTAVVTVTGTAENGAVTNILCQLDADGENGSYEFIFSYDNVSVELPVYTISEDFGGYGDVNIEGTHVESPYQTLGELMATLGENESLIYTIEAERVYAVGEKDGRHYQFAAAISAEDQEALDSLDFFSDTYEKDRDAILAKLVVDDCVDFTDYLIPQSELDAFVGKTAQDILDAGYEMTGWGIGEDGATLCFSKGYMEYDADVALPDDYDPDREYESEDMYGFTVEQFYFASPEYAALPIK